MSSSTVCTLRRVEVDRGHHQCHVVVPCEPTPDLVPAHADFLFRILEGALHEAPLRLHLRRVGMGLFALLGVVEGVF